MTRNFLPAFSSTCLLTFFSTVGLGHHSVPIHYDMDSEISFTGKILESGMRNPHARLILEVTNEDGSTYKVMAEMAGKSTMMRRNMPWDALKVGEIVTVRGLKHRTLDRILYIRKYVLSDGTEHTFQRTSGAGVVD